MTDINLGKKELVHFIGIGGIGMSGLAQIMKNMGFNIQGSDISKNKNTDNCKKAGIKILLGHSKRNISKATIVVRSSAIKKNNVELISVSEGLRSSRKEHSMIFGIMSSVASYEKQIITDRLESGRVTKVKDGIRGFGSKVPFGYRKNSVGSITVDEKLITRSELVISW